MSLKFELKICFHFFIDLQGHLKVKLYMTDVAFGQSIHMPNMKLLGHVVAEKPTTSR